MTKVRGRLLFTFNLKFPFPSVKVPLPEPLTIIDTADTSSPEELFFTFPLMVICEKAELEKILAMVNTIR